MTYAKVMAELKRLGTAQNRKVYARHGVGGRMFGVSYANLSKLKKQIKTDQGLAEKLWASGNHDARVLATMVADPQRIKSSQLDAWSRDLDSYVLTDALAGVTSSSPHARAKMEKWTQSKREWLAAAGWGVLAVLARTDQALSDASLTARLKTIEANIHTSKNRVRYAMNGALISIGLRSASLEKKATAAAKRIGKVEVDHGETGCKTPDAVAYIRKARGRARRRAA